MQMKTGVNVVKQEERGWAGLDRESIRVIVHRVVSDIAVLLNNQCKATRQNPFSLILLSQVFKGRV